jgi:hypothetical protein
MCLDSREISPLVVSMITVKADFALMAFTGRQIGIKSEYAEEANDTASKIMGQLHSIS